MIPPEIIDKANSEETTFVMRPEIYQAGKGVTPWRRPEILPPDKGDDHLLCLNRNDEIIVEKFRWWPRQETWHSECRMYSFGYSGILGWVPLAEVAIPEWAKK